MKKISIKTPGGQRVIGPGHPVFIVAEISCNHRQNYAEAVQLVQAAAQSGADAVKFQTYTPDTITLDSDKPWFVFRGNEKHQSWKRPTLYKIYQKEYTPWSWQPKLKKVAEKLGLVWFSSVFDSTSVDFLEKINVPCYKIASYEATDIPLLKKVAQTKKPVIISIGFASRSEVSQAIRTLRKNGAGQIAVLHCLTSYAAKPDTTLTHLRTISDIAWRHKVVAGISDNNGGIELPVQAVLASAKIVEKHLNMHSRNGSFNAQFSITPKQFAAMVGKIRQAEKILGNVHYGPTTAAESYNRNFRKSIFVAEDIKKGEKFTKKNIRVIRPAYGLEPKYFETTLRKRAKKDIETGTPLRKYHIQ